jgi:hypothetical protein
LRFTVRLRTGAVFLGDRKAVSVIFGGKSAVYRENRSKAQKFIHGWPGCAGSH